MAAASTYLPSASHRGCLDRLLHLAGHLPQYTTGILQSKTTRRKVSVSVIYGGKTQVDNGISEHRHRTLQVRLILAVEQS